MIVGLGKLKFNSVLKNCGYSLVTTWSELISLGINFNLIAKNRIGLTIRGCMILVLIKWIQKVQPCF